MKHVRGVRHLLSPIANHADFHVALAISAASMDVFLNRPHVSSEVLCHINDAYRILNTRLSQPDPVSNYTLLVVTSLSMFELLQENNRRGLLHFQGLSRMLDLHGGRDRLIFHRELMHKIWRYVHCRQC